MLIVDLDGAFLATRATVRDVRPGVAAPLFIGVRALAGGLGRQRRRQARRPCERKLPGLVTHGWSTNRVSVAFAALRGDAPFGASSARQPSSTVLWVRGLAS